MKSILVIYLYISIVLSSAISQQFYFEQTSGVTVNLNSVSMSPDFYNISRVWVCGDSGTVLVSTNEGANWLNRNFNGIPLNEKLVTITSKAIDTAITAGNIDLVTHVYRTVNNGLNWIQVFAQSNGKINSVWMKDPKNGFLCGDPVGGRWSLWKTTNAGLNWDSTGLYLPQTGNEKGWSNSIQIMNNNIWFGTNNSRIYYSSNYGSGWSVISTAPEVNSTSIWFYSRDSTRGCFGGANFYSTTNNGTSWEMHACPGTGNLKGYCFGPVGAFDEPWGPCFAIREGNSGIFMTWQFFSDFMSDYNAPSGSYNNVAYNNFSDGFYPGNVSWGVRNNGGITKFSTGRGGAISIISGEIPDKFYLSQNFPNPFNPTTKFGFRIAKYGFAKLTIYNALGKEIQELVNKELQPGSYEVDWDASDFPSGVYYCKLQAGPFAETKKMVLIK